MLSNLFRGALPYCVMVAIALWALSLQNQVYQLQYENEALTTEFAQYVSYAKSSEKTLERWAESQRSILEWREGLNEALSAQDDPVWGNTELPSEYIRVLREAGIYHGGVDASKRSATGEGDTKTDGNDK